MKTQIYIITNPLFKGWLKVGISQNIGKRLGVYNLCDPFRGFKIEYSRDTIYADLIEYCIGILFSKKSNGYEWYKVEVNIMADTIDGIINHQDTIFPEYAFGMKSEYIYFCENEKEIKTFLGYYELIKYLNINEKGIHKLLKEKDGIPFNCNGYNIYRMNKKSVALKSCDVIRDILPIKG